MCDILIYITTFVIHNKAYIILSIKRFCEIIIVFEVTTPYILIVAIYHKTKPCNWLNSFTYLSYISITLIFELNEQLNEQVKYHNL